MTDIKDEVKNNKMYMANKIFLWVFIGAIIITILEFFFYDYIKSVFIENYDTDGILGVSMTAIGVLMFPGIAIVAFFGFLKPNWKWKN